MVYIGGGVFNHRNKKQALPVQEAKGKDTTQLLKVVKPQALLALERRANWLKKFPALLEFEKSQYASLVEGLLHSVALSVQELPETRNAYFSNRGGFLDHCLSRTEAALSLARAYFVGEDGMPAKKLGEEQKLWMYVLFSAAMLRGIGKLVIDFVIEAYDSNGNYIDRHQVLAGPLGKGAAFYQFDFDVAFPETFRHRLTLLLARQLMPEAGFLWIASDKDTLNTFLALLDEDESGTGTLGMILDKADAMAINRYLSERAYAQYETNLDNTKFSHLSRTFAGGSGDVDLKAGELSHAGAEFVKWLTRSLARGRVMVNQAPLFIVPGGLLMCPDMFKLFVREHPQFKNWQNVQKAFVQMQLHSVGPDGAATQRFKQIKTGQMQSGVVLSSIGVVLPERVKVVDMQSGAIKNLSSMQVASSKKTLSAFVEDKASIKVAETLSNDGVWGLEPPPANNPSSDIKNR